MRDVNASLESLRSLNNPVDRLACLETYLTSHIHSGRDESISLSDVLPIAVSSFADLQATTATAEAARSHRFTHDRLIRTLTAIWFYRHGLLRSFRANTEAEVRNVKCDATTSECWDLADKYRMLLTLASNWMLGRYVEERLYNRLGSMPIDRRNEFQRQCDQLAVELRKTYGGLSGLRNSADRLLCDIRDRRALAQLDGLRRNREVVIRAPAPLRAGIAQFISVNLSPTLKRGQELYGAVIFEADRYHLWCSSTWTELVISSTPSEVSDDLAPDALFDQIDATLTSPEWERYSLQTIIRDGDSTSRIHTIIGSDLTGNPIPLDVLMDQSTRYQWVAGGVPLNERPALSTRRDVSFWGSIQFSSKPSLDQSDDDVRHVLSRDSGEVLLKFPNLKQIEPLKAFPEPLPLTHFERWMIQDCCSAANLELVSHTGPEATRDAFIESSHAGQQILHVSTHGISNTEECEYSYLLLAPDGDRPGIVHFTDILMIDASAIEVVFLNTCYTGTGSRHIGESALSLSWAFLAAGAKSAIASLWPVEDHVAFLFAKEFYERLLCGDMMSVGDAFHSARKAMRDHPQCRRPCQWATFQLLTRPMSLVSTSDLSQPSSTQATTPQRRLRPFVPPNSPQISGPDGSA